MIDDINYDLDITGDIDCCYLQKLIEYCNTNIDDYYIINFNGVTADLIYWNKWLKKRQNENNRNTVRVGKMSIMFKNKNDILKFKLGFL